MSRVIVFAALSVIATGASATTCEDSFAKKGDGILSGIQFRASVQVPDLSPQSAIGQMRGIAVTGGYDVLEEEADSGSMLIEQPASGGATRAFPIIVTATQAGNNGQVELLAKLPGGMVAGAAGARAELCKMLAQLKGGKAGLVAAARARTAVSSAGPIVMDAFVLSQRLSRETQVSADSIPLRYKGKSFTVSGRVAYVSADSGTYRVQFDIPEQHELILRPLHGEPRFKTDIGCMMAKGQKAYGLSLRKGNSVKLTGTFALFDEYKNMMWLDNCRPAN
ncbi:hypothetical protein [Sphingomonas sp. SUN039]|uniref:hypothetical protein n=1 Tax=Sphingomonas sp. SUN039 TaxID=2937787 RepID=UPI002164C1AB|nr:hypothetical protein [Sphingomonas sp. SUN039]UVO55331.1 hypothetical protein M0209_14795 [Sphingomonas sp. SUN039]